MIAKTITYTDFKGNERTETFYFNLSQSELVTMDYDTEGGLQDTIQKIIDAKDKAAIMQNFRKILFKAYGEKSDDGRRFIKSDALSEAFFQTAAFDKFFMELITDEEVASNFIKGVLPNVNTKQIPAPANQ